MHRLALLRPLVALLLGAAIVTSSMAEAALPGTLPLRRDAEPGSEGGIWTPSLLLLGAAVAAGGYLAWRRTAASAARRSGKGGERPLARMSSQALTPHASVHAVSWNGEEYLLACTAQQVTVIARRAAAGTQEEVQ